MHNLTLFNFKHYVILTIQFKFDRSVHYSLDMPGAVFIYSYSTHKYRDRSIPEITVKFELIEEQQTFLKLFTHIFDSY